MSSLDTDRNGQPADGQNDKRYGRARNKLPIPDNLIAVILAYCDASDYISILQASESIFVTPLRFHLCSTDSLPLSFLVKKYPNSFTENRQQLAVQLLLQSILGRGPRNKLKHLELSNLRGVTGASWFSGLTSSSLVSLDLTNCARLDHGVLLDYLNTCPRTLRYLHLNGCRCVGPVILDCIGRCHPHLFSLSFGSCSQRIRTSDVFELLRTLTRLKHLDMQCLSHIHDKLSPDSEAYFMDLLPDSIESINLTGTKPLRLVSQHVFGTMNTYLNRSLEYMQAVQGRVQNIQDNLRALNNEGVNANEMLHGNRHVLNYQPDVYIWKHEPTFRIKMRHLVLDGAGHPHSGIFRGSVATFSLGRCLREVHLAGCEGVSDWEVQALAVNCGETLTCFQMRAGTIGNEALKSLAKYCRVLTDVDVSACFGIGDDGIIALCQNLRRRERLDVHELSNTDEGKEESAPASKRCRTSRPSLTALRAASLPRLTNRSIKAIQEMTSLLVLDIQACSKVEPFAVHETVRKLPCLVEVNAKEIASKSPPLSKLLRKDPDVPRTLKIVNQRVFYNHFDLIEGCQTDNLNSCCRVRSQSQRRSANVPLAQMYHCTDCKLIPALDRGFCVECQQRCHAGHKTFLGSYSRFSCDCPFGVDATNVCKAFYTSSEMTTQQSKLIEAGNANGREKDDKSTNGDGMADQ